MLGHIIRNCQGLTGTRLRQNKFYKLLVGQTSGFERKPEVWGEKLPRILSLDYCMSLRHPLPGTRVFPPEKKTFLLWTGNIYF